jgi:flagellar hook-length control protein FliK
VDAPASATLAAAAPANAATSVAPTAAAAPAAPTASVPFTTQLARPIFSLAAAGTGEHVMTVSVTPDELGPVTVRAHVGAEGVRVELFAPTDHARDAIRAILPDLRRDLAGAGLGGNLNLSSQSEPGAQNPDGQGGTSTGPGTDAAPVASGDSTRDGSTTPESGQQRRSPYGTTSTIDILA